jgi:hypothetical protein
MVLTHQRAGALRRPVLSSKAGAISGDWTVRCELSTVCCTFADRSQGDIHPRSIVGWMDVRTLQLQDRQAGSGEKLVVPNQMSENSMTTKNVALTQLAGIVTYSIVIGMFFIQGLENWQRGNPIYWAQVPVIVAFLVVVISFCRRILRAIP